MTGLPWAESAQRRRTDIFRLVTLWCLPPTILAAEMRCFSLALVQRSKYKTFWNWPWMTEGLVFVMQHAGSLKKSVGGV